MTETKAEFDRKCVEGIATGVALLMAGDLENRSAIPVTLIVQALDEWDDRFGQMFREAFRAKMLALAEGKGAR